MFSHMAKYEIFNYICINVIFYNFFAVLCIDINFSYYFALRPRGPILFDVKKYAKNTKGVPPLDSPLPRAAGEGARKRRALQIDSSRGAKLEAEPQ